MRQATKAANRPALSARPAVCLEASRRQARRSEEQLSRRHRAHSVPPPRHRSVRRARHRSVVVARSDLPRQRPPSVRALHRHSGQRPRRPSVVAGPLGPRQLQRSVHRPRRRLSGQPLLQHSELQAPRQHLERRQRRPHRHLEEAALVPRPPRQHLVPLRPRRHLGHRARRRRLGRRAPRRRSDHRRRRWEAGLRSGVLRPPRRLAPARLQPLGQHRRRRPPFHLEARRLHPSQHPSSSTPQRQPHQRLVPLRALVACQRPRSERPIPLLRSEVEADCSDLHPAHRHPSRRVRPLVAWGRRACLARRSRGRLVHNKGAPPWVQLAHTVICQMRPKSRHSQSISWV